MANATSQRSAHLSRDVVMAPYTVWSVGGLADWLFLPESLAEIESFFAGGRVVEPITWLGLGSNVLIRDGGIRGTVVVTTKALRSITRVGARGLCVEAGVPGAQLARRSARLDLGGLEFMAGIPGTLGGALAMNAGAYGSEIWEFVQQVRTVDRHGTFRVRGRDQFTIGYRSVAGPAGEWFVAAELELETAPSDAVEQRIRELLRQRNQAQPTGQRSCGSVFRNPPGEFAGRLIEVCGLKGTREGGALVSPKHGNFIVNDGSATATDIERLIERVQRTVRAKTGIDLIPEVEFMGELAR